jgi:hypothetical protein
MSINNKHRFAVHKEGLEGVVILLPQGNGDTAMIDKAATDGVIPSWVQEERLISANLKEHRDWYTARCGEDLYTLGDPERGIAPIGGHDMYEVSDLAWDAVDEEGDIVAMRDNQGNTLPFSIAPDFAKRSINLAQLLGLTPEIDAEGNQTGNVLVKDKDGNVIPSTVEAAVMETYHPIAGLDEETLKEVEKATFGVEQEDQQAAQG